MLLVLEGGLSPDHHACALREAHGCGGLSPWERNLILCHAHKADPSDQKCMSNCWTFEFRVSILFVYSHPTIGRWLSEENAKGEHLPYECLESCMRTDAPLQNTPFGATEEEQDQAGRTKFND